MKFVGHDMDNIRMEIMELDNHPYYCAVQYHPEYISRMVKNLSYHETVRSVNHHLDVERCRSQSSNESQDVSVGGSAGDN